MRLQSDCREGHADVVSSNFDFLSPQNFGDDVIFELGNFSSVCLYVYTQKFGAFLYQYLLPGLVFVAVSTDRCPISKVTNEKYF